MRKRLIKAICFFLLLSIVLGGLWKVYNVKHENFWISSFYDLDKDTVDVLFVGSSHVYMDINTNTLWEDYGITSYDLCGTNQPIWNSYFLFKDALKTQKPKVVVVDLYTATKEGEYAAARVDQVKNFWAMDFSLNKIAAVKESLEPDVWTEYILKFPVFHSRYNDISSEDFGYTGAVTDCWKGYSMMLYSTEFELPDIEAYNVVSCEPTEKVMKYIDEIIELAADNDVELVFTVNPFASNEYEESVFKYLASYFEDEGIPFYNFNYLINEVGLDTSVDFFDSTHLNDRGACKYTSYIADNILSEYEIPDRRGDKKYSSYDDCLEEYTRYMLNRNLVEATSLEQYLEYADVKGYTYIISARGNYQNASGYNSVVNSFANVGIDLGSSEGDNCWVIHDGEIVFATNNMNDYQWHLDLNNRDTLSIVSVGGVPGIYLGTDSTSLFENQYDGIRILVYCDILDDFIVNASLSTDQL